MSKRSRIQMILRDFLKNREAELVAKIDDLRRELNPLEAELAEVRRAQGAIGMTELREGESINAALARNPRLWHFMQTPRKPDGEIVRIDLGTLPSAPETTALYGRMTMKELVVKALDEHFPHGATTRQLLDFFRDAWGRDIERTSLSPQLTRLYQEGKIGRVQGLKEWYLVPPERQNRRPFRVIAPVVELGATGEIAKIIHRPGDVVWLKPDEVTGDHFVPEGRPVPDPDPDED